MDTEAKSHGSGGRVLLYIYFLGCATALLFQAATGTGFDAAGASIVVGAGGGFAAFTIVEAMIQAKKEGDIKKAAAIEARKAARKTKRK